MTVLRDSLIKDLNAWEMSKTNDIYKFIVSSIFGAKVQCMKDHINPSLRKALTIFLFILEPMISVIQINYQSQLLNQQLLSQWI